MGVKPLFLLVVSIVLLAPAILAQELDTYNVIFDLEGNKVKTTMEYIFYNSSETYFVLFIPDDATKLNVYLNGKSIEPQILENEEANRLVVPINGETKTIKLTFFSKGIIYQFNKNYFISYIEVPLYTKRFLVNVVLPTGSYLTKHISKGSIVPKPSELLTNGQRVISIWESADVEKGYKMSVFVEYRSNVNYVYIGVAVVVVIFSLGLIFYKKFGRKIVVEEIKKTEPNIDKHLKEEEKAVITALRDKEGQTTQATLRVVTGMSKSTLSRVIMELEERNIVHKEKKGNKNVVTLR